MPATLGDLAALCNVIALCVSADADVLGARARNRVRAAKPGTIVVDHSTVSSQTAKQAHALMRGAGGEFLDAPVSGGVEGAKNGKLSIMVGGDAQALVRVRPVLEAYAARISHMGRSARDRTRRRSIRCWSPASRKPYAKGSR